MTIRELYLKCNNIQPNDEAIIDFSDGENVRNTYKGTFSDPAIDEYQDEDIARFEISLHSVYIIIYGGLPHES